MFGEPYQQALLSMRLQAFLDELGPMELTEAQQRIASAVNLRVEALVARSFQGLSRWQTALRSIANQLEDLERRAKRQGMREEGRTTDEPPAGGVDAETGVDTADGRFAAEDSAVTNRSTRREGS